MEQYREVREVAAIFPGLGGCVGSLGRILSVLGDPGIRGSVWEWVVEAGAGSQWSY